MTAVGIIPARYDSTRFPGKLLEKVNDKYLIQHVFDNISKSEVLSNLYIAAGDEKIYNSAKEFTDNVILTKGTFESGTDRIAWAYNHLELTEDIIFNIQADEPLLSHKLIDELFIKFSTSLCDVGTLVKKIKSEKELNNPNNVKVVRDTDGNAMYFSRSPIPYQRDKEDKSNQVYWKHIGLYAYREEALKKFSEIPQTDLEVTEKLEQLRLLQNNVKFFCMETDQDIVGVDTAEDLEKVKKIISNKA